MTCDAHLSGGRRASQALLWTLAASTEETVTIEELIHALRGRAFGFVLLLVALVNCVPLPPGISTLMGVPVFLVGMQMLIGRREPWLPGCIRRRALRRADFIAALQRLMPYVGPIERICRPRLPSVVRFMVPHLTGALIVALGIYIMIPMMFTNIPPALAAVSLAMALIEEDGLMLLVGWPVALIALTVSTALAAGTIAMVLITTSRFFGF